MAPCFEIGCIEQTSVRTVLCGLRLYATCERQILISAQSQLRSYLEYIAGVCPNTKCLSPLNGMAFAVAAGLRNVTRLPLSHGLCPVCSRLSTTSSSSSTSSSSGASSRATTTPSSRRAFSASASSSSSSLRGFALFRSDMAWLSRLLRGDISVLVDTRGDFPNYDPIAISNYYSARPLSAIFRFARVAAPFALWFFRVRVLDTWIYTSDKRARASARAEQLRKLLCWAGPTYLKIGQAIGNRPDIVGPDYAAALQKLVDDVGTFDSEVAVELVKEQLKVDELGDVFEHFDKNAFASASLGQVHRARLRNGHEVVVKVQRPCLQRTAALDIYVLRKAAAYAKKRFRLRSDLVGIIDEFGARLWEELDYVHEADNCERFRDFYTRDTEDIYVPHVYRDYTSKMVLTMEWIDGMKAPWYPKEDALRLINVGVQCSLRQLLDKGFVHADPHTGNILRMRKGGKLCYLDFGMCVNVSEQTRYNLIAAIVRLINKDYANLGKDFVKLGFLPPDADLRPIEPLLEKAFGDAQSGGGVTDLSFGKLADNLSGLAFATPIRIPVFFTLVIRSLTILEGIALQTDNNFKIVDQSYPYVINRLLTDDNPVLQRALENVLIDPKSKRIRWNRLQSVLQTSSKASRGPSFRGNSASTGRRGGGVLASVSNESLGLVLDYALSERGKFFRNALELELTDTVDAMQLAIGHRISELSGGILPKPVDGADRNRVEAGIALASAVRKRAPELLQITRTKGDEAWKVRERLQRISRQLQSSSRVVAADIAERNARRVLRYCLRFILRDRD